MLNCMHTHTMPLNSASRGGRSQTIIPGSSGASQHPGRHLWESHSFTTAPFSPHSFLSKCVFKDEQPNEVTKDEHTRNGCCHVVWLLTAPPMTTCIHVAVLVQKVLNIFSSADTHKSWGRFNSYSISTYCTCEVVASYCKCSMWPWEAGQWVPRRWDSQDVFFFLSHLFFTFVAPWMCKGSGSSLIWNRFIQFGFQCGWTVHHDAHFWWTLTPLPVLTLLLEPVFHKKI